MTPREHPEIVLGLISLVNHGTGTDATEIRLLEVGQDNVGKKKKLEGIAECLIAFACEESVKAGHEGWVFLKPKTLLISHYHDKYGFIETGAFEALYLL